MKMLALRMSEFWIQLVAVLTVAGSLAVKLIGYPHQMRKIWRSGQTENISLPQYMLIVVTYGLWTVHGILKNDPVIIISQALGIVSSGVLLGVLDYTKHRAKTKK